MTILLTALAMVAPGCHTPACHHRVHVRHMRQTTRPYLSWLRRLEWCESRGRNIVNPSSGAAGYLQFMPGTWTAMGGKLPVTAASRLEQRYRAVLLRKRAGVGQWECSVGT